jgi:hypothetical protein
MGPLIVFRKYRIRRLWRGIVNGMDVILVLLVHAKHFQFNDLDDLYGGFNIASLAVAGDTIIAGTGDGLYESANRGDTWVRNWRMNQADLETFNAILVNEEFIFGATDHDRLYRYSRSQSKWEPGGPSESLKCLALAHGYRTAEPCGPTWVASPGGSSVARKAPAPGSFFRMN